MDLNRVCLFCRVVFIVFIVAMKLGESLRRRHGVIAPISAELLLERKKRLNHIVDHPG